MRLPDAVTLILLVDEGNDWMFRPLRVAIGIAMAAWLMAYLPRALRRVYGGSWRKTLLKVAGLSALYSIVTVVGFIGALFVALAIF